MNTMDGELTEDAVEDIREIYEWVEKAEEARKAGEINKMAILARSMA